MKLTPCGTESLDRLKNPHMRSYKKLYKNSPHWDGKQSLKRKKVILYCEQGFGDVIQFARYFHLLNPKKLYVHCQEDLWKLFQCNFKISQFIPRTKKTKSLPDHDLHIRSMSLPFLFPKQETVYPYLKVAENINLDEFKDYLKIGIAWEGNPLHEDNDQRSFPLAAFKVLADIDKAKIFLLQRFIHQVDLLKDTDGLELLADCPLGDFYDTAKLINSLDMVISVDTSVLHLAGAMGKKCYGLLANEHDPRWLVANWYPSVTLMKNPSNDHFVLLDYVANQIDNEKSHSTQHIYNPHQEIIITGGIGDFIALESHFPEHWRKNIKKIYLATRASTAIKQIISYLPQYKHAKIESLWNNFTNFFAFYNKKEVQNKLPKNNIKWRKIKDWSISLKFPAIHYGYYRYHDSLLSKVSLANLSKFKLPARYATIVFVSENDRRLKNREFSPKDFANLLAFLEKINLQGVIVNRSKIKPPKHKLLIDLSNKTTILESLEIVKQSTCYIGIDSCLAVFAARHLPPERVVIKCINKHAIEHRNIYFRNVELVKRITAKRLKSLDNTLLHHERNTTIKKDSDRKNYDGETTARM